MTFDEPGSSQRPERKTENREPGRPDYADYHDPLAGIGGAPAAYSALTLRLILAVFGLLVCTGGAIGLGYAGVPVAFIIVLGVFAVTAAVDIAVIMRRKRRGEPG